MRALIPVAGSGLRLSPITESKPKVLVEVAGKPVLAHILDNLLTSSIRELVLIVGYLKEQVIEWTNIEYGSHFDIHFIHQEEQLGLGHAIYTAREFLDHSEIMIVLGDEIFTRSYSEMVQSYRTMPEITGAIGIKTVDDPTHYGMVQIGPRNYITHMVEKPQLFPEKTAIAGVYYFKHGEDLLSSLEFIMDENEPLHEYQLTDALQLMINSGSIMPAFEVGDWYDCGRPETLIESNRRLLEKEHPISPLCTIINSEIIEPCYFGPGSVISNSRIGPYVSIGKNVKIEDSTMTDTILESNTVVKSVTLEGGIVSGSGVLINHIPDSEWRYLPI
ncbi:MAG: sugar phosphate nucleotidyltransferase [Candidatus Thorarchaeota archaeon]